MPNASTETKQELQALQKIKLISGHQGGQLLRRFLDKELKILCQKNSVTDLEQAVSRDISSIQKFTHLLVINKRNVKLFFQAIELLAKSKNTKRDGLFCRYIYQSGDKDIDIGKLEKFFTTLNDNDNIKTESTVSEHHIFKKLKSENIFDVLKAFTAFVLREYMMIRTKCEDKAITSEQLKQDSEETVINEELKKCWQQNRRSKDTGSKLDFGEMVVKANAEHARLKEMGLLYEEDNSRNSRSSIGFSTNFVKLSIRFIQRSFSKLDHYVKIYYYPSVIEEPLDYYAISYRSIPKDEIERKNNEIQQRNEARVKQYWNRIKELVGKSEKEGTVYFVLNQVVYKENHEKGTGGHANLTIICGGNYKVFETAYSQKTVDMIGVVDYRGQEINVTSRQPVQADQQNCAAMCLGYMESFMKQMSVWVEKEPYKTDKKEFSKYVWNKINKYFEVDVPDNIQSVSSYQKLGNLLPPKYIRYIQTHKGRDLMIELPKTQWFRNLNPEAKKRIQKVAAELEKVRDKNDISKISIIHFLDDFGMYTGRSDTKQKDRFKIYIDKIAKEIHKEASDVTLRDLKKLMSEKKLKAELRNIPYGHYVLSWHKLPEQTIELHVTGSQVYFKVVDIFAEERTPEEVAAVKLELTSNPVYKCISDAPEEITFNNLEKAERIIACVMQDISRMNDPAQMRRRRNILKVATLVDVLEKRRKGSAKEEVGKVEELSVSTSMHT